MHIKDLQGPMIDGPIPHLSHHLTVHLPIWSRIGMNPAEIREEFQRRFARELGLLGTSTTSSLTNSVYTKRAGQPTTKDLQRIARAEKVRDGTITFVQTKFLKERRVTLGDADCYDVAFDKAGPVGIGTPAKVFSGKKPSKKLKKTKAAKRAETPTVKRTRKRKKANEIDLKYTQATFVRHLVAISSPNTKKNVYRVAFEGTKKHKKVKKANK